MTAARTASNYPLRLDPRRRAGWKRAAELEGRTLAGWIKRVCDQAAEQAVGELEMEATFGRINE